MTAFTPRVMRLLATELTGTPLRKIDSLFEDRGVALGPPQPSDTDESQRRERMRRHLATLNLDDRVDASNLVAVLGDVLQLIMERSEAGSPADVRLRQKWIRILSEDGFDVDERTGAVQRRTAAPVQLTDHALNALEDPQVIHDHLRRLGSSVDADPRLAVSTAMALIESTAKSVLTVRGRTYGRNTKVPAIVSAAQGSLDLAPKNLSAMRTARSDRCCSRSLRSLRGAAVERYVAPSHSDTRRSKNPT